MPPFIVVTSWGSVEEAGSLVFGGASSSLVLSVGAWLAPAL